MSSTLSDADCEALAIALHPFAIQQNVKGAINVAGVMRAVEAIVADHLAQAVAADKAEAVRADRAEALREAADRMPAFHDRNAPEWAITSACKWLRARAEAEQGGGE